MSIIGGLFSLGALLVCGGVLLAALIVGGVLFYSSRQKAQRVSVTAPDPVTRATIEHPNVAPAPQPPVPPAAPQPPVPPESPDQHG
jgi:hypothetical protein